MTICPYCQVRQDIDLRQIHFRDQGLNSSVACPDCAIPLQVMKVGDKPSVSIERCETCRGLFFNPGELEFVLEEQEPSWVWLDPVELHRILEEFDEAPRPVSYRKCPVCAERMNRLVFGDHSGVIVDRCGSHGFWLDGGELRRLSEWWRGGGKLLYQSSEQAKLGQHHRLRGKPRPDAWAALPSGPPAREDEPAGAVSALLAFLSKVWEAMD